MNENVAPPNDFISSLIICCVRRQLKHGGRTMLSFALPHFEFSDKFEKKNIRRKNCIIIAPFAKEDKTVKQKIRNLRCLTERQKSRLWTVAPIKKN